MKNIRRLSVSLSWLLVFLAAGSFVSITPLSEIKYATKNVAISIKGTSTLHDWEIKSSEGRSEAIFVIDQSNRLTDLTSLQFNIPVKSLKSGNNAMDKNTYKALKVEENSSIEFLLSSAKVTPVDALNYQVKVTGKLTIAGTTRETELIATGKINPADKSLTISGTKKIKMTEYNVKPPTVMMGSIKTGNDISISYNLKLIR